MWRRSMLHASSQLHRTVRFGRRTFNGQSQQGPHPTYFQPPLKPPRRILRSIVLATTCLGLGAYAHAWVFDLPFLGIGLLDEDEAEAEHVLEAIAAGTQDTAARQVPPMDLERAQASLELRSGYSITSKAVGHSCQLPSNLPCEDTVHSGVFTPFKDPDKDWATWSIFDGHAGPRTAQVLKELLPTIVGSQLWEANCMNRQYVPNDPHVVSTIKDAFITLDNDVMKLAAERAQGFEGDLAHTISILSPALSGSCALMALFDPQQSILRVANTGDSRAVLGRWDSSAGHYKAQPMSHDQTGFNEDEVARMREHHPGEEVIDSKTGRVHGIAVSRAFGDSRWKWTHELSQLVYDKFWGPKPRPGGVIKTPPYLTAEPEVIETRIEAGQHPDFLIMASDGLWDNISSEDAVICVQQWLAKNKPTKFLDQQNTTTSLADLFPRRDSGTSSPTYTSASDLGADEDTYFDESEGCMKWRVSSKHFVVEDDNCGIHLIKNALGGKRRNLFCGIMSIHPPLSRNVRDDITVHVIFFGVDTQPAISNKWIQQTMQPDDRSARKSTP